MATRTSPDYEEPNTDVGSKRDPVTLPTNMARQAENRGNMGKVLIAGTILAIALLIGGYYLALI